MKKKYGHKKEIRPLMRTIEKEIGGMQKKELTSLFLAGSISGYGEKLSDFIINHHINLALKITCVQHKMLCAFIGACVLEKAIELTKIGEIE